MFVSGADGMSVFLESIETGAESHTLEFLANDIKRVIESAPNAKIADVVMDNTSANKAAWRLLLQDSYPIRFSGLCCS